MNPFKTIDDYLYRKLGWDSFAYNVATPFFYVVGGFTALFTILYLINN